MGKLEPLINQAGSAFYLIFRLLVGLLFFLHGWSKFSGQQAPMGLILVAGIIELAAGIGIFLGLLTRGLALIAAIQMIVAYFKVHVGQGWNPLVNGGELALMFLAAFLILLIYGAQKWSLETKLLKKELF